MGIIIAQIIRRTQLIERGRPDPFPIPGWSYPTTMDTSSPIMSDELNMNRFVKGLEEADNVNAKNHALLRLVLILENGKRYTEIRLLHTYSQAITALDSKLSSRSAIEWVLERGSLIENLKEAIMGNYQSIVSLTTVLESGTFSKRILDTVIDRCKFCKYSRI